jgi:hypothetical protein
MGDQQQPLIPEVLDPLAKPLPKAVNAPNGGNGRPKGAPNLKHEVFKKLAYHHAVDLTERLIAEALAGDMYAMRIIMDRIWPRPRTAPIQLKDLPATQTPEDIRRAMHQMLQKVAAGEITAEDGAAVVGIMQDIIRAYSIDALTGGASITVQTSDSRGILAERLARAIEARKQIEARKNETAQTDDAA